ncbi:mannose-binding protein c [Plakobranchus ocellatus]|uniref:Mannose-binding protein c n=1 Tax=Plakobranchus ocellatus TaxID=259542 RepID=A0AAV3ZFQ0_9GAST|nr:mannose-binding protein c [Plakobranchus ocellatus]
MRRTALIESLSQTAEKLISFHYHGSVSTARKTIHSYFITVHYLRSTSVSSLQEWTDPPRRVFLGGTDKAKEGVFVWDHSGELFDQTYTNWPAWEPNNLNGEDYVSILTRSTGMWNDHGLSTTGSYVCETVYPEYNHSYVMVLPKDLWADGFQSMSALLSVSSRYLHLGHNYVEFSTFPDGFVVEASVTEVDSFQYRIDVASLTPESYDAQQKYVLVRSSKPLDVRFFMWNSDLTLVCSVLVLDALASGETHSFLGHSGSDQTSLVFVSTDDGTVNFQFNLPSGSQNVEFSLDDTHTQSRNITGLTTAPFVQSNGSLSVFIYERDTPATSVDATMNQILPLPMSGSIIHTFPSLPMNSATMDQFTLVAAYKDTVVTVHSNPVQTISLSLAGESYHLSLPASSFHVLRGTKPFYLYAKYSLSGSIYAGCYLLVDRNTSGTHRIQRIPSAVVSFGAYVYARGTHSLTCFPLGASLSSSAFVIDKWDWLPMPVEPIPPCNVTENSTTTEQTIRTTLQTIIEEPTTDIIDSSVIETTFEEHSMDTTPMDIENVTRDGVTLTTEAIDYSGTEITSKANQENNISRPTTANPNCEDIHLKIINKTLSAVELNEVVEQIVSHLHVEKTSLSSSRRKKESSPDNRVSSTSMGVLSISIILTVLALFILPDFLAACFGLKKILAKVFKKGICRNES